MWTRTYATHHRAKPIIQSFSTEGYPVNCGPAWYTEKIEAEIIHVPHMSAKYIYARTALRSETHTKVQNGFSKNTRIKKIKDKLPSKLKVSPTAYIHHKSRQYQVIIYQSFRLRVNGK